ncbi:sensor histidine kinase [Paenibacillus illinoisensis]|uniref:sensor histidine kinase n=1 Tax=Paenibacillus illinoisensis TaxID=59845 RepID=UPI003D2691E6
MTNLWKKMKIRWKFVWLCSLVLLIQFTVSNIYLFSQSSDLILKQGENLIGKYLSQSSGSVRNELKNVESSANILVINDDFQRYLRKYAVRYFENDSANIDFQFDVVQVFRNLISQTGNIREVQVHLEQNTFMLTRSVYVHKKNEDLATFNEVTAMPRSNIGWQIREKDEGEMEIFYRVPLSAIGKTTGIRGWIDVVVHPSSVFQAIKDMVPTNEQVQLFVIDQNAKAIYSNTSMSEHPSLSNMPEPGQVQIQDSSGRTIMSKTELIDGTEWQLLATIPEESFQLDLTNYIKTSLLILFIPIILLVLAILFMTNYMLKPLKQLVAVMGIVNRSNVMPQIVTDSQDEFGLLANRFNNMMERIDNQISVIREAEQLKREAEMRAFQSQIRQHFLYNTLALISWNARKEKAQETERISNLFARYYRLALGKGETYIALEREIELLHHYLDIQCSRFVDQLEYDLRVEVPIEGYRVIRNILQPLVENAIEHGVMSKESGKVFIRIHEDGEFLAIRIMDDGSGADPDIVRCINENIPFEGEKGFSLLSIKQTLHSYYGQEASLDFQSVVRSGTVVTVKLLKSRLSGH